MLLITSYLLTYLLPSPNVWLQHRKQHSFSVVLVPCQYSLDAVSLYQQLL